MHAETDLATCPEIPNFLYNSTLKMPSAFSYTSGSYNPVFSFIYLRGAVVEWLERLAVVRKVADSSPARAKRLENSLSTQQRMGT